MLKEDHKPTWLFENIVQTSLNWDIKDHPKYPTEWANLEDEEKRLKEDHQPTWIIYN
jgi:hypothetical protein